MKKLLVLTMVIAMTLSFTACGKENTPASTQSISGKADSTPVSTQSSSGKTTGKPASTQSSSDKTDNNEKASKVKFVNMTFGNITMDVPNVFGAVTEKDGVYLSAGSNASIAATQAFEVDLLPSDWDESFAAESLQLFYGSTFTNMKLAAFQGDVNLNGNTAVYYSFYGKNSANMDCLVQIVLLYNADLTAQYAITFLHEADDELFTTEMTEKIINSITLSKAAQHMKAESEG